MNFVNFKNSFSSFIGIILPICGMLLSGRPGFNRFLSAHKTLSAAYSSAPLPPDPDCASFRRLPLRGVFFSPVSYSLTKSNAYTTISLFIRYLIICTAKRYPDRCTVLRILFVFQGVGVFFHADGCFSLCVSFYPCVPGGCSLLPSVFSSPPGTKQAPYLHRRSHTKKGCPQKNFRRLLSDAFRIAVLHDP